MLAFSAPLPIQTSRNLKKKKKIDGNLQTLPSRKIPSGFKDGVSEHATPVVSYPVLFLLTHRPTPSKGLLQSSRNLGLSQKNPGSWLLIYSLPSPPTTSSYLLNANYVGGIILSTKDMIRHIQKWGRHT